MGNKYFIYNVVKLLSEKTGQKTSEIDNFMRELVVLFNESITSNNFVKIKGIGAFKVVQVKERESVNVNTGVRFLIRPHNKLSFIPEKKMKDMINKPFALFETIEAQEDNTGLMNLTVVETEIEKIWETGDIEDISDVKDFKVSNDLNDLKEIEDKPLPPPPPSLIEEKPMFVPPPPSPPPPPPPPPLKKASKRRKGKSKKSKLSSTTLLVFILFFLLFVFIGGAIYYFFFYNRLDDFDARFSTRIPRIEELSLPGETMQSGIILEEAQPLVDTLALTPSEVGAIDTTQQELAVPAPVPVSEPATEIATPRQEPATRPATTATTSPQTTTATTSTNNIMARVRIEPGQRLTLIAEQYYGNKVFWVYIYEHNKDQIGGNPNILRTGMEILVPARALYGIDANNAASIDKATDIQRRILEGI